MYEKHLYPFSFSFINHRLVELGGLCDSVVVRDGPFITSCCVVAYDSLPVFGAESGVDAGTESGIEFGAPGGIPPTTLMGVPFCWGSPS